MDEKKRKMIEKLKLKKEIRRMESLRKKQLQSPDSTDSKVNNNQKSHGSVEIEIQEAVNNSESIRKFETPSNCSKIILNRENAD